MTVDPSAIVIERHVAIWFYVLAVLTATLAVGWMARRRLLRFGARLLGLGIGLNALWELLLFSIWTRQYETLVPTVLHAVYQSTTEFGPPFVVVVLLLDRAGVLDLSSWEDSQKTRGHHVLWAACRLLIGVLLFVCARLLITSADLLTTPITVTRVVDIWYFGLAAVLAILVVGVAVRRRDRVALLLFLVLGSLNTMFEVVGLLAGYRQYESLSAVASIGIGFSESGTAAALVWMVATTWPWRQVRVSRMIAIVSESRPESSTITGGGDNE